MFLKVAKVLFYFSLFLLPSNLDRPTNRGRYGNFNNDDRYNDRNHHDRNHREGSFGGQSRDGGGNNDRYNSFSRNRGGDREQRGGGSGHFNHNERPPSVSTLGSIGKVLPSLIISLFFYLSTCLF